MSTNGSNLAAPEDPGRLRAWLELARISNLPTVVTNALVGAAAAAGAGALPPRAVLVAVVATALLYVAGMILNDAVDAERDARERPGRPIPSGRVGRGAAYGAAAALLVAGPAVALLAGPDAAVRAAALAIGVVLYDVFHDASAASVLVMGARRGLVYVVAGAAVAGAASGRTVLPFALAMTAYVVLVTVLARGEATARGRRWPAITGALALVATIGVILFVRDVPTGAALAAAGAVGLAFATWTGLAARHLPSRPPRAIMGWLAGICLADAFFLVLLERPFLALVAVAAFVVTTLGHRRILGS